MKRRILFSILLLIALCFSSFNFIRSIDASGGPYFSIVDAKRTYYTDANTTTYGYSYSITIKNIGDYAESVVVRHYFDFMENGTKSTGASYHYSWNTSETRGVGFGLGWPNESAVPPNKWIKLELSSPQNQTFLIYFDTVLDVSASPSEPEYPQEVTISGRLMNITSGTAIPNQDLSLYINGVYTANIQTDSYGNYTYIWLPTYGTHHISVIWGYGEGAVGWTYVTVQTPTIMSLSLSSSTTYIGFKVDINGRLTYTNGSGIPETPISLQLGSDSTSLNTEADGSYSAQWIPTVTGVYMVRASWSGKWDESGWILGANATVSLAVTPFAEQYVFSVLSNSTASALAFNSTGRELSFTVSGPPGTTGYISVTIAKPLIGNISDLKVYLNGTEIIYQVTSTNDSWLLYFTYHHSINNIMISLGPLDIIPPTLTNLGMQPEKPTPDDMIIITIAVTDDKSGVKEVNLHYSTDGGTSWNKVSMSLAEGSTYMAIVPRQTEGTSVQYYIESFDNSLNKATSNTNSYTVEAPSITPLIGAETIGVIIIVIVAVAVLTLYKRKSRTTTKE